MIETVNIHINFLDLQTIYSFFMQFILFFEQFFPKSPQYLEYFAIFFSFSESFINITNILLTNVFYTKIPRSLQSLRYFILVLILL